MRFKNVMIKWVVYKPLLCLMIKTKISTNQHTAYINYNL